MTDAPERDGRERIAQAITFIVASTVDMPDSATFDHDTLLIRLTDAVLAEIARVTAERDTARRYGEDLYRRAREVTCVWCGHQFESTLGEQADALRLHAETCEKHPIRALTAELADLRRCIGRLVDLYERTDPNTAAAAIVHDCGIDLDAIRALPAGRAE